jgi:uncharacterized cupin superfamily protein
MTARKDVAIRAADALVRTRPSNYPEPFASRMTGRQKQPLGDLFGLGNFGVNLTRLAPGAMSALRHAHSKQDEFVYVLQGTPTLFTDEGATRLEPGMCAGFKAGTGNGHHLVNETSEAVVYLEVGDRSAATAAPTRTTTSSGCRSTASGSSPTRTDRLTRARESGPFYFALSADWIARTIASNSSRLTSETTQCVIAPCDHRAV